MIEKIKQSDRLKEFSKRIQENVSTKPLFKLTKHAFQRVSKLNVLYSTRTKRCPDVFVLDNALTLSNSFAHSNANHMIRGSFDPNKKMTSSKNK